MNSANDETVAVGNINHIFVDTDIGEPGDVVINDFTGGVAGQTLNVVVRDTTSSLTITDESNIVSENQEIYLHDTGNDLIIEAGTRGGVNLICDGSNWYDVGHAKHV